MIILNFHMLNINSDDKKWDLAHFKERKIEKSATDGLNRHGLNFYNNFKYDITSLLSNENSKKNDIWFK